MPKTTLEKVREYCLSTGFERDFEEFAEQNAEVFEDIAECKAQERSSMEHKLEYTECYQRFIDTFQQNIMDFIVQEGGTEEEFLKECQDALNNDPTSKDAQFLNALLALSEYTVFHSMMLGEARRLSSTRK
mmetsp:Transcript_3308/g.4656  ORF Transcript_3308/g.4656 Transcript_3308/m.4656 type:complete len:131 (-) Transcript_3308:177-569(-)|eukprot:CAMPEP_0117756288 /NCGR_PEP_ID=MMETSP0947-20121206/13982_1 /TAXON_ID=44440 /ORGANISM="Chattonella subsalsa, Strain CCMP2191" /LENGTH=130 /DNA_ID=CAMNT_0005575833 /DNA_START=185 /DNA_END=577 /DNA_ORIENTATION=-